MAQLEEPLDHIKPFRLMKRTLLPDYESIGQFYQDTIHGASLCACDFVSAPELSVIHRLERVVQEFRRRG
jgi:hypothetical protein